MTEFSSRALLGVGHYYRDMCAPYTKADHCGRAEFRGPKPARLTQGHTRPATMGDGAALAPSCVGPGSFVPVGERLEWSALAHVPDWDANFYYIVGVDGVAQVCGVLFGTPLAWGVFWGVCAGLGSAYSL